jgi:hypothetical protein
VNNNNSNNNNKMFLETKFVVSDAESEEWAKTLPKKSGKTTKNGPQTQQQQEQQRALFSAVERLRGPEFPSSFEGSSSRRRRSPSPDRRSEHSRERSASPSPPPPTQRKTTKAAEDELQELKRQVMELSSAFGEIQKSKEMGEDGQGEDFVMNRK